MADYAITFARSARKELEKLEAVVVQRIVPKIEALARDPRPPGCRKLRGEQNLWRLRIGDYRVVYSVYDKERHHLRCESVHCFSDPSIRNSPDASRPSRRTR